jgi:hypothetical protein
MAARCEKQKRDPQKVEREVGRLLGQKHAGRATVRGDRRDDRRWFRAPDPSRKKITRLCREISEMTSRRWTLLPVEDRVAQINRKLIGWSNDFCLGPVSKAYAAVDRHVCRRLRQWLCAKHKVPGQGTSRFPDKSLHQTLGLVKLPERTRSSSWANS